MIIPESEVSGSFAEIKEGSAVTCNISDTSTGVDFPLAECAEFSLNDHDNIMIKIYQLNIQKINLSSSSPQPNLSISYLNHYCKYLLLALQMFRN